jgi:acyl-CoA synthetase (AMP-forming)/AMP-acid ligase II
MHGNSQWAEMLNALSGRSTVVSAARKMDTAELWRIVAQERVQLINIVGDAQARPLIEELERVRDDLDVSSLFVVASGGAILSPAVKARFAELLPSVMLVDGLGASETGYQGVSAGADSQGRPRFSFGEHTIVLADDGNPTTPGDGVVGRLARRGFIPLGYYKDQEKTEATFPTINGQRWVVPGDMAVAEADGTITLLGRGSVCINSGGEKIFPEEVELVLKGHPAVYDVVVVGVPDERWGERVTAVIAARGDERPDPEELAAFAKQHIASYKVPREVTYVDALVRSPSGKADYRWAKAVAMGESPAAG